MDSNSCINETHFQQQNYLFLFDKEIKFSERNIGDSLEHDLTPDDYLKMRAINRKELSEFINVQNEVSRKLLTDQEIDERFKIIL